MILATSLALAAFLFAPLRTNVLLLGIDHARGSDVARSDTLIMTTIIPTEPYVGMVSVPRDLWVAIPGVGENRINTAHFFGEAQQEGGGPPATLATIEHNFGVKMDYYLRIRFAGFKEVVNALGGVDIHLERPMAGYPAGDHHLTGNKALAFARSRMGADDFFRMEQGQILLKSLLKQAALPASWPRLPAALDALIENTDTNLPWWQWPRLGLAVLRAGPDGIANRAIQREMVTPFTSAEGASVLLPDWNQINPLMTDVFRP
ncbi:MAG: LCP family protein [Chloroflexi bacterium]|nr:LCP family protein [Chloroflexota bacterium]